MSGFRKFLMRGNLIDLAVAVVIGLAFANVVTALVKDIITPLIGAAGGSHLDFSKLAFTLNGQQFLYGDFINFVVTFVIVSAVVYFLVVAPYNRLRKKGEVEQAQDTELAILTEIRNILAETNGSSGKHVTGPGTGPSPDTAETTSADRS